MAGITDDSVVQAESVLRVIRQLERRPAAREHVARLIRRLEKNARAWYKEQRNAAIEDLKALGHTRELKILAEDSSLHHWVRHQAARDLVEMGEADVALTVTKPLLHDPAAVGIRNHLVYVLGDCGAEAELEAIVISDTHDVTLQIKVIDKLRSARLFGVLKRLASESNLSVATRDAILLALTTEADRRSFQEAILALISELGNDTDRLGSAIDYLCTSDNWYGICDFIHCGDAP
jgi:hypothetical protein